MTYKTSLLAEHIYTETITNMYDKLFIVDDVYTLLAKAYENVAGGFLFANKDELIIKTDTWEVFYYEGNVIGVVLYKAKKGLKMVALAIDSSSKHLQNYAKKMMSCFFKLTFSKTWMEVSEAAEKFIRKHGGEQFLIPSIYAKELLGKDVELCNDGFHYTRVINGIVKTKVIIGTPQKFRKSFY